MINLESKTFETEVLFLQPTWSCGKNCPGCYVKEKEYKFGSEEMSLKDWILLLHDILITQDYIKTNQVTLALDTIPHGNAETAIKMYYIAEKFVNIHQSKAKDLQVHLTVNCANDLRSYFPTGPKNNIDLLSISNINNLDDIQFARQVFPKAKINWNILSSSLIKKDPKDIKQILAHVNQAYLLLHKAPLGHQEHDWDSWQKAFFLIAELRAGQEEVPETSDSCLVPNLFDKIIFDGCVRDAWNYAKDKKFGREAFGCSSNVSRFQIWPDGRVTGCAYNSHEQYGKKVESFSDIVNNLRDARTRYEFHHCTIPQFGREKLIEIRR